MDAEVLRELQVFDPGKQKGVLATIVNTKGSTPRGIGVSMLIYNDGRTVGTIGGGCAEAEIKQAALIAMDDGRLRLQHADLTGDIAEDEGMVCGGIMDVAIEPIKDATYFQSLAHFLAQGEGGYLYSSLVLSGDEDLVGKRALYDGEGTLLAGEESILPEPALSWFQDEPHIITAKNKGQEIRIFVQPLSPPLKLLILGAGHVGQAVAKMAVLLDYFGITVIDDRRDFANGARFPGAQVICNSFAKALENYPITPATYIVIVTRGHRYDEECLKQVVSSPAAYIGLIGSRRRTRLLLRHLHEIGYPQKDLDRVVTPIGLDIGGETPEEIAVSILAEIISLRRKGKILPS